MEITAVKPYKYTALRKKPQTAYNSFFDRGHPVV